MDMNQISAKLGKSKVSFPELLDILLDFQSKRQDSWKDEILAAFQAYDTSHSGYIDMKDLKHVMLRTGEKLTPQEFEYMLYQSGINKSSARVQYKVLAEAFAHT